MKLPVTHRLYRTSLAFLLALVSGFAPVQAQEATKEDSITSNSLKLELLETRYSVRRSPQLRKQLMDTYASVLKSECATLESSKTCKVIAKKLLDLDSKNIEALCLLHGLESEECLKAKGLLKKPKSTPSRWKELEKTIITPKLDTISKEKDPKKARLQRLRSSYDAAEKAFTKTKTEQNKNMLIDIGNELIHSICEAKKPSLNCRVFAQKLIETAPFNKRVGCFLLKTSKERVTCLETHPAYIDPKLMRKKPTPLPTLKTDDEGFTSF